MRQEIPTFAVPEQNEAATIVQLSKSAGEKVIDVMQASNTLLTVPEYIIINPTHVCLFRPYQKPADNILSDIEQIQLAVSAIVHTMHACGVIEVTCAHISKRCHICNKKLQLSDTTATKCGYCNTKYCNPSDNPSRTINLISNACIFGGFSAEEKPNDDEVLYFSEINPEATVFNLKQNDKSKLINLGKTHVWEIIQTDKVITGAVEINEQIRLDKDYWRVPSEFIPLLITGLPFFYDRLGIQCPSKILEHANDLLESKPPEVELIDFASFVQIDRTSVHNIPNKFWQNQISEYWQDHARQDTSDN